MATATTKRTTVLESTARDAPSLETLPLCVKCSQNHQHLPDATRYIECLENKPSPQRRRVMHGILHLGGYYCSSCYIREAPELRHSCPRCIKLKLDSDFSSSGTSGGDTPQEGGDVACQSAKDGPPPSPPTPATSSPTAQSRLRWVATPTW